MKKDVDVLNRAMEADYASFKSDQVSIEVNKKFFTNLETLAMVNNVSNYSLFLSTLYILLYKYTSKTNLIIKTPFSERISKEFQDVINNFSNDIILNQDIAPNSSYLDFVKSLNEDIINILSNKLFSYEFFDNEEKENASLFDALLFYHESDAKISNISDIDKPNLLFEIDLHSHTLYLEFNKNVIEVNVAKSLLAHYFFLLKQISNNINCKINDLEFITPEEHRLLEKFKFKDVKNKLDVLSIFGTNFKDNTNASHTSLSRAYSFLKTYDYSKVNSVLSRNTYDNFKNISKTDPRKYFAYTAGQDFLVLTLLMNF